MKTEKVRVADFAHVQNGASAGRLLATFWQPIALSNNFPAGKARRIKVLGEHFTLYRGSDGAMRLTQDRCPHRGTSLAYGWVEENSIRCRYHGWKFDGAGKGEDFPAETASYQSKICLKSYPICEYLGLVFGYFGGGEPPRMWNFPELENDAGGELFAQEVVLPYNYFQRIENDHDEVHAHFTHYFMKQFGLTTIPRMSARETDYGMKSIATYSDGRRFEAHCFMPNILLRQVPIPQEPSKMSVHLAWRVPIDDESSLSYMVNRVTPFDDEMTNKMEAARDYDELTRRVMACEISLEDIDPSHGLLPIIQDTVSIGGQGVIANREAENLGQSDVGVAMLRRIWAREMEALEKGLPSKNWFRPETFAFEEHNLADVGKGDKAAN
jgi:5,5'-dehydrodivanillate O-demethylase